MPGWHKESCKDFRETEADATDPEIARENVSAASFLLPVYKLPKSHRVTVPNFRKMLQVKHE